MSRLRALILTWTWSTKFGDLDNDGSMDLATVALVLQDEYAIRIDEDDYPKLTTIRLIAEYVKSKMV